jgi:hypothetical protein
MTATVALILAARYLDAWTEGLGGLVVVIAIPFAFWQATKNWGRSREAGKARKARKKERKRLGPDAYAAKVEAERVAAAEERKK